MPEVDTRHPLIRFLRDPHTAHEFGIAEWESLLRAARRSLLLPRVAWLAEKSAASRVIPEKVNPHLQSAQRVAQSHARSVAWESQQLQNALSSAAIPFILLKGAAYLMAGLEAGQGRLMSDIDIMVPRNQLEQTEKALIEHGWFPSKLDAYDQRYYRQWMHEIPPLRHLERGTSLDVHHTILPPTASLKPDVDKLWQASLPVVDDPLVRTLAPIDMILHSAVHLFHDGDMQHGLRDLVDIDALIGQFSATADFWQTLIQRAIDLDLVRPCLYAMQYCRQWLGTTVPESVEAALLKAAPPSALTSRIMGMILPISLGGVLETSPGITTRLANFAMYVRSHYLRMPMYLLIPHLLRKQLLGDGH